MKRRLIIVSLLGMSIYGGWTSIVNSMFLPPRTLLIITLVMFVVGAVSVLAMGVHRRTSKVFGLLSGVIFITHASTGLLRIMTHEVSVGRIDETVIWVPFAIGIGQLVSYGVLSLFPSPPE